MKKTACIIFIIVLLLSLAGCAAGEAKYDSAQAELVAQAGRELAADWLAENLPGGKVDRVTAYIVRSPEDGCEYLTDYAQGTYVYNGVTTWFNVNTVSGDMYFPAAPSVNAELAEMAEAMLFEKLGLSPENPVTGFTCSLQAPVAVGEKGRAVPGVEYFELGLPAGAEDMAAFLTDPASRPALTVRQVLVMVGEETDLSGWDMAAFSDLEAACGMDFGLLKLTNGTQSATLEGDRAVFEEKATLWEDEKISLWGAVYRREESASGEVSECRFDPATDLTVEKTEGGYAYSMPNESWQYGFNLVASRDPGPCDLGTGEKTLWEEQQSGEFVLVFSRGGQRVELSGSGEFTLGGR